MGVPASVIFEGKFSSNSMSQLQLLNTTVTSIALNCNKVLTSAYHACYSNALEGDELVLLTAPLASTAEVEALYTSGIIDIESALPAALHSLGASAVEIDGALLRRRTADDGAKNMEALTAAKLGDADVLLKNAQTSKLEEEILTLRANVKKTDAETKNLREAPTATAAAANGGGSGGGGSGGSGGGGSGGGDESSSENKK